MCSTPVWGGSIAKQAREKKIKVNSEFTVTPGSEQIRYTVERDGLLKDFEEVGGLVLANACGPCIGQWARHMDDPKRRNSIITSFNRNFAKRNDGNASTHAFVASPEIVTALVFAGDLTFNPLTDTLINEDGQEVRFDPPSGVELPPHGFDVKDAGFQAPASEGFKIQVDVDPASDRLQLLTPFEPITPDQVQNMRILLKAQGKCTTDHISMAGPWLKYRGHLENISNNCFIGAINAFNGEANKVINFEEGNFMAVPDSARTYQMKGVSTIVFGEENYGEGSSREHAAMEPRYLGVKAIVVKSFARIHQTNLKKQGMLALTFVNPGDYDLVRQDDVVDILGFEHFNPDSSLTIRLRHADGTQDIIDVQHGYNAQQAEWVITGSALNTIREGRKNI
jgi:aconitate hydratase